VLIVNVRGMEPPMEVVGIMRGRDLPASILAAAAAGDRKRRGATAEASRACCQSVIGPRSGRDRAATWP